MDSSSAFDTYATRLSAQPLRCNLGMSEIDRLLVGFLCQVVRSPLLQEHT
jgi:hypothetical protein